MMSGRARCPATQVPPPAGDAGSARIAASPFSVALRRAVGAARVRRAERDPSGLPLRHDPPVLVDLAGQHQLPRVVVRVLRAQEADAVRREAVLGENLALVVEL